MPQRAQRSFIFLPIAVKGEESLIWNKARVESLIFRRKYVSGKGRGNSNRGCGKRTEKFLNKNGARGGWNTKPPLHCLLLCRSSSLKNHNENRHLKQKSRWRVVIIMAVCLKKLQWQRNVAAEVDDAWDCQRSSMYLKREDFLRIKC